MHRALLPAPLLLLAACGHECTLIGCVSRLTLQVHGAGDAPGLYGTVSVGGETFAIDCAGTSDPGVACDGNTLQIGLSGAKGGDEVTWSLTVPSQDTGMGGGSYVGSGTFTPEWTGTELNGEGCGVCWSASGAVEVLGTP